MFYLGCHLSVSDGYTAMGQTALSLSANTFQFFTRNPRGGARREASEKDIAGLIEIMKQGSFGPIIAHAPYVYNPATGDEKKRQFAVTSMKEDVLAMEKLPGVLYNFHPGCHVGQGSDVGIANTASVLKELLPLCQNTTVLIETMAGKGSEIGQSFEEVRAMIDLVPDELQSHLGVCLDTCHVNDAGYPIAEKTDEVLDTFDRIIGLGRLRAIHLNDSKNPLGARKDRHEKIGQGTLTMEGILSIIRNPRLRELPFCLETPCDLQGYGEEIALLRSYRND